MWLLNLSKMVMGSLSFILVDEMVDFWRLDF